MPSMRRSSIREDVKNREDELSSEGGACCSAKG